KGRDRKHDRIHVASGALAFGFPDFDPDRIIVKSRPVGDDFEARGRRQVEIEAAQSQSIVDIPPGTLMLEAALVFRDDRYPVPPGRNHIKRKREVLRPGYQLA